MHAYGIGIHYECAARLSQRHDAELLLKPAEKQSDEYSCQCSEEGYQSALKEEYTGNLTVGSTEISERHHIVLLVDYQHGYRTDDIEARHDEYKREEDICDEFLHLHYPERVCLLLIAVEHTVAVADDLLHLLLHGIEVAAVLQANLQRRQHSLLFKQCARHGDWHYHVVAVVFSLFHHEDHSWRNQRVNYESVGWIGEVELSCLPRSVYHQVAVPVGIHAESLGEAYAHHGEVQVCSLEQKRAVAIQYVVNARHTFEIVVNAHHPHHGLLALVYGERLVLHTLRRHVNLRQLSHLLQQRVVGRCRLSLCRHEFYLRVEGCEERCHEVVETVEHTECHHESHRGHCHTNGTDAADDVYGVCALL